jgi:hypothetical protein
VDTFPLFTLYSALVTSRGGTPIPSSNTRYWDKPVYPTVGGIYTSISALNSAIAAASSGAVLRLANGTYNSGTITVGKNGVTVAAETRGSVVLNNSSTINVTANTCNVFGFDFSGSSSEKCVNVTGTDAVVGYNTVRTTFTRPDLAAQTPLFDTDGARARFCYNTVSGYRGVGRNFQVIGTSAIPYCRIDHNESLDCWSNDPASNDNEIVQVGQQQNGTPYFALVDNNHWYRWQNTGSGTPVNTEAEMHAVKSDANFFIRNVIRQCKGSLNFRHGSYNVAYANFWMTGSFSDAGGVGIWGTQSLVACNYIINANFTNFDERAAFKIGSGDNVATDYFASVNAEISFNTVVTSVKPILFSPQQKANSPSGTKFYNNAISKPDDSTNTIIVDNNADTGSVFGGNVMMPTVGRSNAGITAALPQLEVVNNLNVPTAGGNCDGGAVAGFSSLITVDILGNPISANSRKGCCKVNPTSNPWQALIDGAGADK